MGVDMSIMKLITQPFNHCIDVADDMTCQSKCCWDANSCACDTKNSRASTMISRQRRNSSPIQHVSQDSDTQSSSFERKSLNIY